MAAPARTIRSTARLCRILQRSSATPEARARSSPKYVPHRPHQTVLYGIVREHLATFLAYTESIYTAPLPRYVVDTFEHYLGCGDLARGFLRCHCDGCGHDVLVAFSLTLLGIQRPGPDR